MKKILFLTLLVGQSTTYAALDDKFFVAYKVAQSSNLPNAIVRQVSSESVLDQIAESTFKQINEPALIEKYRTNVTFKNNVRKSILTYLNSDLASNFYDDAATKIYNQVYSLDELKAQYRFNSSVQGRQFLQDNLEVNKVMQQQLATITARHINASSDQKIELGIQNILQTLLPPIIEVEQPISDVQTDDPETNLIIQEQPRTSKNKTEDLSSNELPVENVNIEQDTPQVVPAVITVVTQAIAPAVDSSNMESPNTRVEEDSVDVVDELSEEKVTENIVDVVTTNESMIDVNSSIAKDHVDSTSDETPQQSGQYNTIDHSDVLTSLDEILEVESEDSQDISINNEAVDSSIYEDVDENIDTSVITPANNHADENTSE